MDLDYLKQQWKEDESMHPAITFKPELFREELSARVNGVKSLWLWALLAMVVFFVSISDAASDSEQYIKIAVTVATTLYLTQGYFTLRPTLNPANLSFSTVLRAYRFGQKHAGLLVASHLVMIVTDLFFREATIGDWLYDNFGLLFFFIMTAFIFFDFSNRRAKLTQLANEKETWYQYFIDQNHKGLHRIIRGGLFLIPGLALILGGLYYWDYISLSMAIINFIMIVASYIVSVWMTLKRNKELNRDG